MQAYILLLFGISLVIAMIIVILFAYSSRRKTKIEEPKYRMMEDDEEE